MIVPISPALQRAAALAILLLLVAMAVTGIIVPVVSAYTDAARTVAQERDAVARASASDLDPVALKAALARLRSDRAPGPGLLHSANESLAAAELQSRFKAAIEAAHGELRSLQTLPSRMDGGFRRITIRGQATVNTAGLREALYDLEAASPLLFLDNVQIDARPDRSGRPGAAENPNLDLRLDIYGYMRSAP